MESPVQHRWNEMPDAVQTAPSASSSSSVSEAVAPVPAPPAKPMSRRRRRTREALLDAGFAVMADQGFDAMTIAAVTDRAELAVGSFYNHFASKEALKAAVVEHLVDAHGRFLDWICGDVTPDAAVRLAVATKAILRKAEASPAWGDFIARHGLADRTLRLGLMPESALFATEEDRDSAALLLLGALQRLREGDLPLSDGVAKRVLRVCGLVDEVVTRAAATPLPEPEPPAAKA